jgi:hypothetical protein
MKREPCAFWIMIYAFFYQTIMKIAHHFHWHYAPPIYPDGDTHLWCQRCGFRQTIKFAKRNDNSLIICGSENQAKQMSKKRFLLERFYGEKI